MGEHRPPLSAPEPVDLFRVAMLLLDARHDTSAGLVAREELLPVVGGMVAEVGLLRDTVTAYREDLEDMRAEVNLARSLRLEWSSTRAAVNPDVHTPARTIAYLKALSWVLDYDRNTGQFWRDKPDRDGRSHFVFVPVDQECEDWDKKMAELVRHLANILGVGELQILADIAEAGNA